MAEQGSSTKDIYDECVRLVDNVDASFVIDSLDFLYKGGRGLAVSAFGANLIKLKPCIFVQEGKRR